MYATKLVELHRVTIFNRLPVLVRQYTQGNRHRLIRTPVLQYYLSATTSIWRG